MAGGRSGAVVLLVLMGAACDDVAPRREIRARVGFDGGGRSAEVAFDVPPGTRSIAIVARGDDDALIALATLTTADGVERVGLIDGVDLPGALAAAYHEEQIGGLGAIAQSARLGL